MFRPCAFAPQACIFGKLEASGRAEGQPLPAQSTPPWFTSGPHPGFICVLCSKWLCLQGPHRHRDHNFHCSHGNPTWNGKVNTNRVVNYCDADENPGAGNPQRRKARTFRSVVKSFPYRKGKGQLMCLSGQMRGEAAGRNKWATAWKFTPLRCQHRTSALPVKRDCTGRSGAVATVQ